MGKLHITLENQMIQPSSYHTPHSLCRTPRASKLNIRFQVRPNSLHDAILLYTAESALPSGDYVAVVLRNRHVELIINTGARLKPVIVRSINALPLHKWTEIEIARRFGEGILRVGEEAKQKGKATGAARTLYLKTPLYLGGYDNDAITLNRDVNISKGFDGCISNVSCCLNFFCFFF